jgi:hypothetical protein
MMTLDEWKAREEAIADELARGGEGGEAEASGDVAGEDAEGAAPWDEGEGEGEEEGEDPSDDEEERG